MKEIKEALSKEIKEALSKEIKEALSKEIDEIAESLKRVRDLLCDKSEVIEVGDIVRANNSLEEGVVVGVKVGKHNFGFGPTASDVTWVVVEDGVPHAPFKIYPSINLTLIRKGPKKHVFEGVRVDSDDEFDSKDLDQWASNGKNRGTYRMTLEEMP